MTGSPCPRAEPGRWCIYAFSLDERGPRSRSRSGLARKPGHRIGKSPVARIERRSESKHLKQLNKNGPGAVKSRSLLTFSSSTYFLLLDGVSTVGVVSQEQGGRTGIRANRLRFVDHDIGGRSISESIFRLMLIAHDGFNNFCPQSLALSLD
jgi:hypothetical protein